ncbi:choice-of-anchor D domain-containing protein [Silvibacterium sp.]|uniref:NHL domain-containing protein n=1 Tax=Silvibacterium sp. TaxID=1964179 RepID=UPI0039E58C1D
MQPPILRSLPLVRMWKWQTRRLISCRVLRTVLSLALTISATGLMLGQLVPVKGISTIAGNGSTTYSGDGGQATAAGISDAYGIVVDGSGNISFSDSVAGVVRSISSFNGTITTVAGNGTTGYSGDNGSATSAELNHPAGVALDSDGNLYIADTGNNRVRKVDDTFTITTVAGNGTSGYSGDGGAATGAELASPAGIAVDSSGNIYIADAANNVVREIAASTGIISTIAGTGSAGSSGDGGLATSAKLNYPLGVALDSAGNLYIADGGNNKVREVAASTGIITTVAGTGTAGYSGDGGAATSAELYQPSDVKVDAGSNLYICDSYNNRLRVVSGSTGIITTLAGNGTDGHSGDGGPAPQAELQLPAGIALDRNGNLYSSDLEYLREISPITFPNTNVASSSTPVNLFLATTAAETITSFKVPASQGNKQEYTVGTVSGCTVDGATSNPAGTICTIPITFSPAYPGRRPVPLQAVTSTGNTNIGLNGLGVGPLAALTPGIISTIAGTGGFGYTGDGGAATSATINGPEGVVLDNANNLYFSDDGNHAVRRIDAATGVITTVAGNGQEGFSGDGGAATSAELNYPVGLGMDSAGNLYIADHQNFRIRRVDAQTGIITTVAGNGTKTDSGDGGPATSAGFHDPSDVKFDSHDNLYIADGTSIRRVDASDGIITTIAGNGTGGDGSPAIDAAVSVNSLAFDSSDNLYLADPNDNEIRVINASTGYISTVAGTGNPNDTDSGDGGPATSASLNEPLFVVVDSAGDFYISEANGSYIRMVSSATGIISSIAGTGLDDSNAPGDNGPATKADLGEPTGIALDGSGNLYSANDVQSRIRKINVSQSALVWPTPTAVGTEDSSDDPETAILNDIGNNQLSVPFSSSPADPVTTPGWALDASSTCSANGLSSFTLLSGQNCTLPVDFTPTASGTNNGTMVLTDNSLNNAASTQTISLTGTGTGSGGGTPQATLTPSSLSFTVSQGAQAASQTANLTNTGSATLDISSITITGSNTGAFQIAANSCGTTLAAGATCSVSIGFIATSSGSYSAALTVNDNASPLAVQTATLTGTVTGATAPPGSPIATLTPTSLTYTATAGTSSAAQTATLTNSGTAVLNIASISLAGANASEFAIGANTCGATLAAGASCTIAVTFAPDTTASFTATLSVADDAAGSPQTAALTGTGTAAPATADFTVAATPSTQSVTAGNAATFTVNVASTGGSFTSAVALAATGLPPGATVSFSPTSVTPGASGATSTMTMQTAAQSAQAASDTPWSRMRLAPIFAALLILIPGWRTRRRWNMRMRRAWLTGTGCLLLLLGTMAVMSGCGAGFALPQAASSSTTYTVTVTGTSGSVQHSTTVQLTVK